MYNLTLFLLKVRFNTEQNEAICKIYFDRISRNGIVS